VIGTESYHCGRNGAIQCAGGIASPHKAGISLQTYYRWRKKYGGLMPSEMKRLKLLEEENTRLKKLVADLSLDKAMLQDVVKRKL
jgi:putative transposase